MVSTARLNLTKYFIDITLPCPPSLYPALLPTILPPSPGPPFFPTPGPPFFPPPTLSISGFCRKGTVRHMGQSPHSRSHLLIHSMWKGCPHGRRRVAMPLGLVYLRNEWQIEHISFFHSSCRSLTGRSIIARAAVSTAAGGGGGGILSAGAGGGGGHDPTLIASSRWVPGRRRVNLGPPTMVTSWPPKRMPRPPPPLA